MNAVRSTLVVVIMGAVPCATVVALITAIIRKLPKK